MDITRVHCEAIFSRRVAVYLSLAVLLSGLLFMSLPNTLAAGKLYDLGKNAYQQKNYPLAEQYFTTGVQQSAQTASSQALADYQFYLGLTYARTERYAQAKAAFEQVIQSLPETHPLVVKARNNITYIASAQMSAAGQASKAKQIVQTTMSNTNGNYLAHVLYNGKVIRFDEKKMPLKVFIENGTSLPGWNPAYRQVATAAYQNWQRASVGRLRFTPTTRLDQADIVVRWRPTFQDNILGVSPFETAGNLITRSDVSLALYYQGNQLIPQQELVAIATHEFGHALGIKGHSPYPTDLMYFSRNQKQSTQLTSRDINTLKALYKTAADVKNSPAMSTAQANRYLDLFKQGVSAQQANQTLQAMTLYRQAIQLAKTAPEARYNLGILLINAGTGQIQQNNMAQATQYYQEALQTLSPLEQTAALADATGMLGGSKIPVESVQKNLSIVRHNLSLLQASTSPGR